jgi:hypothetical protein
MALTHDKVAIHTLAKQMGTSIGMIEQHYSHLDAVKAVHQLRGTETRQLFDAIDDDENDVNEDKSPSKSKKSTKK